MNCNRSKSFGLKGLTLVTLLLLLFTSYWANAQAKPGNRNSNKDTTKKAAVAPVPPQLFADTLPPKDTTVILEDSGTRRTFDTIRISPDTLDAPIQYQAEDSGILIIATKQFYLYGSAKVDYKAINLEAGTVKYDQSNQTIAAYGSPDTATNNPLNKPKLTQEGSVSISDTIYFNTKTQKGLTKNTFYQEGEMFIQAGVLKKTEPEVAFAYKSRFTTCNLDTPHFAFRTSRMKVINNKFAVAGLTYPEFEGVPMPVGIPFGIFPMNTGRRSGLLPPQFAVNEDMGLGLEGLGYYKIMNDHWDVVLRTNIYSYGGYMINVQPRYLKRYRYTGNLDIRYMKTKLLNRNIFAKQAQEFNESSNFSLNWSHSRDSRAKPGTNFSANVNFATSKFYQYIPNNTTANFQNQLSSSVTWSKTYGDGKANLSVSANHNQNSLIGLQNINPMVNFTANTLYPFGGTERIGPERWYHKIGFSYNGQLESRIPFYDTAFNFQRIVDTVQWGITHNPNINVSLPPLGPVIVTPGITYGERWYGQRTKFAWNPTLKKVDTTLQKGFYTARELQFSVNASSRIFGTFNFGQNSAVRALRHEIKPSISFSYRPDLMSKYYHNVQIDTTGKNFARVNDYMTSFATFSEGVFGGLNFGIDNLLEMKVRDKNDTSAGASKKVRLIDGLSITSSYNFLVDSFQLQPININLRSTLFEKVSITGSATLDPYQVDTIGRRVNRFTWQDSRFSPGRFLNANLAISTQLQSKKNNKGEETDETAAPTFDPTMTPAEQQRELEYIRMNPSEFVDFDIPWTVQLSFSMSFFRTQTPDLKSFRTDVSAGLNASGDFSLSPKWKIGGSTFLNVRDRRIESLTMFISREMHCWQMAINITPVGLWRMFSISISPKSGILRDLRINRSRTFYQ